LAVTTDVPCTSPAMATLVQHLCVSAPDRAEPRGLMVEAVVGLVAALPPVYQRHFVRFLTRFGRNKKPQYRLCAVEIGALLLTSGSPVLQAPYLGQAMTLSPAKAPGHASPSQGLRWVKCVWVGGGIRCGSV
jgi:hypothetical protein